MELAYNTFFTTGLAEKGGEKLESTVAALLLVTSTVVLSCFVVVYTVNTVTQTFNGESPTMQLINHIQDSILNSTSTDGGTIPFIYPSTSPTTTPAP
jgi:hypothetical protein